MHEASMVSGIIDIVLEEAQKHGAIKVNSVKLETGLLAGVEAETLAACFELMVEGTIAEKAVLEISPAPLNCICPDCGHKFILLERKFRCPQCAGIRLSFEGGHGCRITGIEAEMTENPDHQ